jgi:Cu/Ag efflux pump CusA
VQSPDDIAKTVVAVRGGIPVLLGQVADVRIGGAPKYGDASVNAKPAVVLAVQKQPGANTLELTSRIETELSEMQRTLPRGMKIHSELFRQADFISIAIENVIAALRDGAVFVISVESSGNSNLDRCNSAFTRRRDLCDEMARHNDQHDDAGRYGDRHRGTCR